MRKLTVTTFLSLDGVMQGPGGSEEDRSGGFYCGGWLIPYFDEAMERIAAEWVERADAFILGRTTYEIFAGQWRREGVRQDRVACALNERPKYVVSRTLKKVEWNNSSLLGGNVVEEIKRLKARPGRELQVHGSAGLAQTLIEYDLVDEYRLWWFPVVLGSGKRLFGPGAIPTALRLIDMRRSATGVAIQTYERTGAMKYGAFAIET